MPKQHISLNNYSGGINSVQDPRDLEINELVDIDKFMIDQQGAIRTAGGLTAHSTINNQTAKPSGGYGLAVLESDYETEQKIMSAGVGMPLVLSDVYHNVIYKSDGSITAFADAYWGNVTVTCANHGLNNGNPITISSTTNYNGNYIVANSATNTFTIIATWAGDDATGVIAFRHNTLFKSGESILLSLASASAFFTVIYTKADVVHVLPALDVGGSPSFTTGNVVSLSPTNEVLLVSADAVNGKVDTYSKNQDTWTADQITIDSTGGYMPNYAKTIYYTVDGAIRACDAELGNASRVRWFGLIKRTDFEGTTAIKNYYDWYEKDNKLSPPTVGAVHAANYPTANSGFNVSLTMASDDNSAWEAATYEVAFSFIYDGNQESLLYIPTSSNIFVVAAGEKVSAVVRAQTSSTGYNERISGGRIYARISGSDDAWFLLVDIDMRQGARATLDSKYTAWATVSPTTTATGSIDSLGQNIDNYENLNGYSHQVVSISMGEDGEGYKACVVGNRRVFVANVRRVEDSTGVNKSFPDRIYYSVANKFDTFPIDNYIDVVIGDSESYTALAIYADRLLAFKENTLYIVNISSGSQTDWYVESKHKFMGVKVPAQITETEFGIAWVNKSGCYFYGGSGNPVNLIGDKIAGIKCKIDNVTWKDFIQSTSMAGYIREKKQLLIMKDYSGSIATSGDCYLFDFPTYSWVKLSDAFIDSKVYTNFVQDWNGDLVVGYFDGSATISYYKWSDTPAAKTSMTFTTKDIDFGDLRHIKKIYKVIFTYKSSVVQTNALKYDTNGGTSFSTNVEAKDFSVATAWDVETFTPTAPIECQSFALKLTCPSSGTFNVNDITIIYRTISKEVS